MVFGISKIEIPILLLVLFSCYLIIGFKFSKKDVFSPWIVTSAVWVIMCILIIFMGDLIFEIKGPFYISLFIWVTTLFFSSIFAFKVTSATQINSTIFNRRVFYLLVIISILLTPIYLYIVYKNLGSHYNNLFLSIRQNANTGVNNFGGLIYLKTFNPVLLITGLIQYKSINKWVLAYLVISNILMGMAIMEKGTFLLVMTAILYILNYKGIISLKAILISLALFLGLSYVFNTIRSGSDNYRSFSEFFACYIISPCAAFETLKPDSSDYWGASTFPFFYIFSNALFNNNYAIVSKLKDFVYVPISTNVYTIMQPFYEDFGYFGIGVFGVITGLMSGYIYKRSFTGSPIMIGVYVYILYSLILQFFQENIFVSLSVVIQFCFFMWLIYSPKIYNIIR